MTTSPRNPLTPFPSPHFSRRQWITLMSSGVVLGALRLRAADSRPWDRAKLQDALEFLEGRGGADGVKQVVIADRTGVVWRGEAANRRHGLWSCTKSFTTTCLGLMIDDGRVTLDTPITKFVPELGARYDGARFRHFASMTSGFRAQNDEPVGTYAHGPSRRFNEPDEPLFAPPGSKFAYWDSAMNLLGLAVTRVAGEPLRQLFQRRIATPIGWSPGQWDWPELKLRNGEVTCGGAGNHSADVRIAAADIIAFGRLFLDRGLVNGRRVLSENWIRLATAPEVPASTPLGFGRAHGDGPGQYGFGWWVNGKDVDGRRRWEGAPAGTFSASGYNNNDLFVIPEWDLIVVRLGLDQKEREILTPEYAEFLRRLGAARQA